MATSTRLRGNQGFYFSLKQGASAAATFDDVKAYDLTWEDKDDSDVTFFEATSGQGQDPQLSITAVTSFDTGSLYKFLWDNAGKEVAVVLGPKGNGTASASGPHFTFTGAIPGKPGLALEATSDPKAAGAEFEFTIVGNTDVTWKTS